jgi:hypothetical protein
MIASLLTGVALTIAGPSPAAESPEVKAILDNLTKAVGGADKLPQLHAGTLKGKAQFSQGGADISFVAEMTFQGNDHSKLELEITAGGQTNKVTLVMTPDKAFMHDSVRNRTEDAPMGLPKLLHAFLLGFRLPNHPAGLRVKGLELAHGGEGKVGDVDAVILRVSRKEQPDHTIYFDKKTGLPLKCDFHVTQPDGMEADFSLVFSDFKLAGGIKHYMKVKMLRDGNDLTEVELTEFNPKEKVDANTFDKPQ